MIAMALYQGRSWFLFCPSRTRKRDKKRLDRPGEPPPSRNVSFSPSPSPLDAFMGDGVRAGLIFSAGFDWLLTVITLGFIVLCCIPSLHTRARGIVQPFVIYHVESGLYWVQLFQRYRTGLGTLLADSLCHTVSVGWYSATLPIIMWMNPYLGTHMTLLMAITQYIGNAMKDLVSAPRPSRLKYAEVRIAQTRANAKEKEKNAAEYGFPSSHAMNSLAYNFYFVLALHRDGVVGDEVASFWYGAVMMFVSTVAVSRVYLGLHTPIDILGGAVAGLAVVTSYTRLQWAWDVLDVGLYGGQAVGRMAATGLICLVLLRLHPTPASHTPSYEFSTSFIGVAFGVICGVQMRRLWYPDQVYDRFGFLVVPGRVDGWIALRALAGLAGLGLAKIATKWVFSRMLPIVYTYFPIRIRSAWQPPVVDGKGGAKENTRGIKQTLDGRDADIDATTRFASYAAIGLTASLGVLFVPFTMV